MNKTSYINFQARPLNNINIQKYNKKSKCYTSLNATFVKLDINNAQDMLAVSRSAEKWRYAAFVRGIETDSRWMNLLPIEIYALTTQNKNFDKLKDKYILGFAEMRPDDKDKRFNQLYYLQVKPGAAGTGKRKSYKNSGTAILTSLKKIYKNISLYSIEDAIEFYQKNNFIKDVEGDSRFLWSSGIFGKLIIYLENLRKCLK